MQTHRVNMADIEENKIYLDHQAWKKLFAELAGEDEKKSVPITDLKGKVANMKNDDLVQEYGITRAQLRRLTEL